MLDPAPVKFGAEPDRTESPHPAERLSLRAGAVVWVLILSFALARLAFFYSHHLTNLYGDGIAHMEGARRLFDSLTPGYPEIGSVWLPLYHLLVAPLAINEFLWKSGLAGSLVSTAAYVVTAWLVFRLALAMNQNLAAGVVALAGFLLCPNLAYLATTPMTEPLTQLWAVGVVYGLCRFREEGRPRALVGSAVAAFLGTLTRYDGWYLVPFATLFVFLARAGPWRRRLGRAALFSAIASAGPLLWLAHNAYRFGNAVEFYNGPFSAKAIYAHQLATTAFPYPTDGSLLVSARYFLEDLKLVIGPWPLELAALGLVAWAADASARGRRTAALLLLVPLPFYLHSMAYAAVPMYVPTLFPQTYYNLRYGLEMLPAVAVFPSFLLSPRLSGLPQHIMTVALLGALVAQSASLSSRGASELAVVKEAILNTPCKSKKQHWVLDFLRARYDGGTVLLAVGKWPCVLPAVGIPFRKTVTETNRTYWRKLRTEPEKWVEWIIRGEGDPVDELMRAYPEAFGAFDLLAQETFSGEGSVAIYRRRVAGSPNALQQQQRSIRLGSG